MTTPAPATSRNPALVLIHGAVLNGGMWSPIIADLAADFQTVTPDMPGHGARMSEPFRLDRAVAVVQETVAALAPAPVVLVGDSLGSYVSIAAAGSLGSQVKGAVLGGGTGNFQGPVGLACAAQIWLTNRIPPAKLQAKLEKRVGEDYAAGPAILARGMRPAAFAEGVDEFRRTNFRTALERLEMPILFVNGARDWAHRLGERDTLAAARHGSYHRIPGAGHGVSILHPAVFAGLVREFVTTHGITGSRAT